MTHPADLPATALIDLYRAKALSPVEVVKAVLQRAEALEPVFNAFRLLDAKGAIEEARGSEARWLRSEPRGLLDGVPVAFKDLLDVRGWPTRRGSLATTDRPAPDDAPAAARLRESGAIFLGKTNTAEFGWKSVTESALAGITRNPWNRDHTPTGSSGGAAAAAALGLGPLHVGTDGGGSIRIPASACGVFGLKPSYGRVPGHPAAYNGTMFHIGPITRTVADAALLLNVITGYDARDWTSLPPDDRDWRAGLAGGVRGLRIAYSRTLGHVKVDASILSIVDRAVETFSELGATVAHVDPGFDDSKAIRIAYAAERAARLRADISPDRYPLVDAQIRDAVERADRYALADYVAAMDGRMDLAIRMRRFHERYDLLLTPTMAAPVPKVGTQADGSLCVPFNLTQQPAASVPCGVDEHGLPVGLQIVGPPHRDDLVLRAAHAYELAHPFRAPPGQRESPRRPV
ncbi:MAG TPA: amidase [Polyangiaceae bacterium]|jgi:aspartyl-tRNA(Asn)/glutamyl-tRNA(Gln) amidotransferase subunit A